MLAAGLRCRPSAARSYDYAAEAGVREDVPARLGAGDAGQRDGRAALARLEKAGKGEAATRCTTKCVTTCVRGGSGAPGLGPISQRRDAVVFKEGFRSRAYCLEECSDVCTRLNAGANTTK